MFGRMKIAGAILLLGVLAWSNLSAAAEEAPGHAPTPVGAWRVWGRDSTKTDWLGTLVLTTDDAGGLAGYVDWFGTGGGSDGAAGREHLTGTYDPATRTLTLTGVKLQQSRLMALGSYKAVLTASGAHLVKARRFVEGQPPVAWEGHRVVMK